MGLRSSKKEIVAIAKNIGISFKEFADILVAEYSKNMKLITKIITMKRPPPRGVILVWALRLSGMSTIPQRESRFIKKRISIIEPINDKINKIL